MIDNLGQQQQKHKQQQRPRKYPWLKPKVSCTGKVKSHFGDDNHLCRK